MTVALTRSPAQFQRPFCEVTTASQSFTNGNNGVADLPTSATVDNGLATCGTALLDGTNDRVYLRRPGVWHLTVITNWAANGTGLRQVQIQTSGSGTVAINVNTTFTASFVTTHSAETLYYTSSTTEYASAYCYESGVASLSTTTTLRAVWLGALS